MSLLTLPHQTFDAVVGSRTTNLSFGRAAGVHAGETDERAALRHQAFRAPDRVLVQRGGAEIPVNRSWIHNAVGGEIRCG